MPEFFIYRAENGNTCEIVDTFAEMFTMMEISRTIPLLLCVQV